VSDEKDRTCETCDECVYLGEGDFACMGCGVSELLITCVTVTFCVSLVAFVTIYGLSEYWRWRND